MDSILIWTPRLTTSKWKTGQLLVWKNTFSNNITFSSMIINLYSMLTLTRVSTKKEFTFQHNFAMRLVFQKALQRIKEKWEIFSNTRSTIQIKEENGFWTLFLSLQMMLPSENGELKWMRTLWILMERCLVNHPLLIQSLVNQFNSVILSIDKLNLFYH